MMGVALDYGVLIAMTVMVVLAFPSQVQSEEPPGHFLLQAKSECFFSNGTGGQVILLDRFIYDRQEFVRFDSRVGRYEAVTELGETDARYWNSQPEVLESRRAAVDTFCRYNYELDALFLHARKVQPKVKIILMEYDASTDNTLLVCTVTGFYPLEIEIKWLRNGEEEDERRVVTTAVIRNGDWTYQIHVMLETRPERGDVYGCQVEHASLKTPITVQWEPNSDSARSKTWTGVVGIVLGLVFILPGLILYLKNKKGPAIPQPAAAGLIG